MCTSTVPRMSVPWDNASSSDPRFGLLSVATVVDDMDTHAYHGIEYTTLCEPRIRPYPAPGCAPDGAFPSPEKLGERTTSLVTADPFVLYAVEACPPLGSSPEQARDRLRARLTRGESHMVEYVINNGLVGARPYLRDPNGVVLNDGEPLGVAAAIGRLEHHLALLGRVGTLHVPRWLAPTLNQLGVIHRHGPTAQTFLGNTVVFGSGYDGRGPEGTDDTDTWLYATPTPTVRRSAIVEPATWHTGGFNPRTNQGFLLAERIYVVDWPCPVAAVRTTPSRPEGLIPADAAIPPTLLVTPDHGSAPLEVVVSVDNHGNGSVSVDFGDGSPAVDNPGDGVSLTSHTYTTPGAYVVTATSHAWAGSTGIHPLTVN